MSHENIIVNEFSHQAGAFDRAAVMSSAETLGALVELVGEHPRGRWLEVACGTGVVSRALAGRVAEVHGVDLTAAMLDVARREASAAARYATTSRPTYPVAPKTLMSSPRSAGIHETYREAKVSGRCSKGERWRTW